jgi:hypothetical protein
MRPPANCSLAMATTFATPPDEAYAALDVKRSGQKWFAFDGSMDDARKGNVSKFVMAVWNFHSDETVIGRNKICRRGIRSVENSPEQRTCYQTHGLPCARRLQTCP